MSLVSMTGFGSGESTNGLYSVKVELKSVNHRFKDFRFKMAPLFNSMEMDFRKKLELYFFRGSIDVYVSYKKDSEKVNSISLDFKKVEEYLKTLKEVSHQSKVPLTFGPGDFLRSEFYLDQEDELVQNLGLLVTNALDLAISNLKESREEEGRKLEAVIKNHKQDFIKHYREVETQVDFYKDCIKEKLEKKIKEYSAELKLDEPRFLQEVIYYLEKLDVHEELNRIESHLDNLDKIICSSDESGRKMDFVIQELNRETNTIGSKSGKSKVSDSVIEMKVHLEKMREQALNIE